MEELKLTNNEVDNKSIYFHFSTDSRHLKIGQSLITYFTDSPKLSETNNQPSNAVVFQQTKIHLANELRLADDYSFQQQFKSWEQPEV